jgi:hypothetical protein
MVHAALCTSAAADAFKLDFLKSATAGALET